MLLEASDGAAVIAEGGTVRRDGVFRVGRALDAGGRGRSETTLRGSARGGLGAGGQRARLRRRRRRRQRAVRRRRRPVAVVSRRIRVRPRRMRTRRRERLRYRCIQLTLRLE